jgi:cytosine deaminase
VHPARLLRLPDYGLTPGCYADLVVWDCAQPEDTVATMPPRTLVLKRGRVTIEARHEVIDRWRA